MAPLCKNTTIAWNIYYSSIVQLLLEIALDPHAWGGTSPHTSHLTITSYVSAIWQVQNSSISIEIGLVTGGQP